MAYLKCQEFVQTDGSNLAPPRDPWHLTAQFVSARLCFNGLQAHGGAMLKHNGIHYWYGENKNAPTEWRR